MKNKSHSNNKKLMKNKSSSKSKKNSQMNYDLFPTEIQEQILSNFKKSKIIEILNSNPNKNIEDLLERKIQENELKIDNLINDIYILNQNTIQGTQIYIINNFQNDFFDALKQLFIINYDNAYILKWVNQNIYIDSLNFEIFGVRKLPDSFGNLKVKGDLNLSSYIMNEKDNNGYLINLDYQFKSLPNSFGNIEVGGNLDLSGNELKTLPKNFGNIKVGGYLNLHYNQLTSLPTSFGKIKVGGDLDLSDNQINELTDSFVNLKVGGNLDLSDNLFLDNVDFIFPDFPNVKGFLIVGILKND